MGKDAEGKHTARQVCMNVYDHKQVAPKTLPWSHPGPAGSLKTCIFLSTLHFGQHIVTSEQLG